MTANSWTAPRPSVSTPCAQCGDFLVAPVWSEYVRERCIRHLWICDACGYAYETTVYFPAEQAASTHVLDDAA